MPYSAEHRTQTKKNIIDSARKLFNRHGFEKCVDRTNHGGRGTNPGRLLFVLRKQERFVCRSAELSLYGSRMEKLLGARTRRPLSSTDVGAQVVPSQPTGRAAENKTGEALARGFEPKQWQSCPPSAGLR
jgi:hypothetical protein